MRSTTLHGEELRQEVFWLLLGWYNEQGIAPHPMEVEEHVDRILAEAQRQGVRI